jgi:hypothetical protein
MAKNSPEGQGPGPQPPGPNKKAHQPKVFLSTFSFYDICTKVPKDNETTFLLTKQDFQAAVKAVLESNKL